MNRMDAQTRAEIARIEERLRKIERRGLDQLSRIGTRERSMNIFVVVGGQVLPVIGLNGIQSALVQPTSILDYDLLTLPTTVDGIGYGTNTSTGDLELLLNAPPCQFGFDVFEGQTVECATSLSIPVTASSPTTYRTVWVMRAIVG